MDRKHFIKLSALGLGGAFLLKNQTTFARQSSFNAKNIISESHPIVIIGSGYGGSVAALRLCNAGKKVVLLEMGLNWQKNNVPFSSILKPGKSAAWLRKRTIAPLFNVS